MKLLVLTGLVVIEKISLAVELAGVHIALGNSVSMIDNIARIPIDSEIAPVPVERIEGDITTQLDTLKQNNNDVIILAVSESTNPDTLFTSLELLRDSITDLEIETIAMIDLRTCDCFPNVRQSLEMYADKVLMMPYDLEEVLDVASIG